MSRLTCLALVLCCALPLPTQAAGPANRAALQQQQDALRKLERYDGTWRGEAISYQADGTRLQLVQTERVGPMLDGTLRVIEGRGYAGDGTLVFNAFAVISFSPQSNRYHFRSHAQGYSGDFPMEVTDEGFSWSIPAGAATIRYTSRVKDGTWTEIGERVEPGREPVKIFEMRLQRIGNTDWPAAGAVGPR